MRILFYFLISSIFAQSVLAETHTFECFYPKQSGYSEGKAWIKKGEFKITFLVDESAQKSYIIGNNGSNEVIHIMNDGGMTFVEVTGTGNVMTTTIASNLNSVHSRNTIMSLMNVELIPSQYYGSCAKK